MFDLEKPAAALEALADQPFGFCFVDLELGDLSDFDRIKIAQDHDFNAFGSIEGLREKIGSFFMEIGPNSQNLAEHIAEKINAIAVKILEVSQKPVAWICLRASTPNNRYDIPRWHMDGHYFRSGNEIQYKFAVTLIGASTLFYPIAQNLTELRRVIWIHMGNRGFMHELCGQDQRITVDRGIGAFFIAADQNKAAIHSEPPVHENRLFFSIVPCREDQIETLRQKVMIFYTQMN